MGGASAHIQGDAKVMRDLQELAFRVHNLQPAFERIGEIFRDHEKRTFQSEGSFVGATWTPLSPRYAAWKMRKVGPKPILQFSGRMYASFTIAGAPDNISNIGAQSATFGSSIPYGKYHQSRAPRRVLPRRPMLVITPAFRIEVHRVIKRWITEGEV